MTLRSIGVIIELDAAKVNQQIEDYPPTRHRNASDAATSYQVHAIPIQYGLAGARTVAGKPDPLMIRILVAQLFIDIL